MELEKAIQRARRGFRDDRRLHLFATASLTVAFVCLGGALLTLTNVSHLAERWGESAKLSIYLRDGASSADVAELELALRALPEVRGVDHWSAATARARFLEDVDDGGALGALPADAFPASLEVKLAPSAAANQVDAIASRVERFAVVESVDTYRSMLGRLDQVVLAGRVLAAAIAALVVLCVIAVVGSTIRLAVAGRRQEIEVMKLCGATDAFVRKPFLVEGAIQTCSSAALATAFLFGAFALLRAHIDAALVPLSGLRSVFLAPEVVIALVGAGTAVGMFASALALRRHLTV